MRAADKTTIDTDNVGAFASCGDKISDKECIEQQQQANASLLISGSPTRWIKPGPPKDSKSASMKSNLGEPNVEFKDVDNPDGWDSFTFRPRFL